MKRLIEGQDYVIRKVAFPNSMTDGAVVSCADGVTCVYINSRVCMKRQREALIHELAHIANDDLYSYEDIVEVESR